MLEVAIKAQLGDMKLDVAFAAPAGVTVLFGPSGAGKTSVVNAVAGLIRPDAGRIVADGVVLYDASARIDLPARQRAVGYVFQDARLFPHMTVAGNLAYGGNHDAARIIELLGLTGLLDRWPADLSGGEKSRVALGRALMRNPRLILMDEPLASLDAPRKGDIMPYLERLRDQSQVPILYVTHAMSEVARLATTLVMLNAGKVVRAGPVGDVLSDPAMASLIGPRDAGAVISCEVVARHIDDGVTEVSFSGGRLILPGIINVPALRLRIPAQDVILSAKAPEGLSALNVIAVTVTGVSDITDGGAAVGLLAGKDAFWAKITKRSAASMAIAPGQQIFAIIKANAMGGDLS